MSERESMIADRRLKIEREAERMAFACEFGVSEWEAFVSLAERKLIADGVLRPACTGCIGTARAETLVEDLACPIHGIAAQETAEKSFPDRQAWLDSLARGE
jgi:hypothetical protein